MPSQVFYVPIDKTGAGNQRLNVTPIFRVLPLSSIFIPSVVRMEGSGI